VVVERDVEERPEGVNGLGRKFHDTNGTPKKSQFLDGTSQQSSTHRLDVQACCLSTTELSPSTNGYSFRFSGRHLRSGRAHLNAVAFDPFLFGFRSSRDPAEVASAPP
jgi:hypothetical protein